MRVYLSLPSCYFSFCSLFFPFLHLWSHASTRATFCPLHWLNDQGPLAAATSQFTQNNSLPNVGAESPQRRAPTHSLVESLPTSLPKGLGELCCWTAFFWGEQGSPRAPNPRRQRTPALCRTAQHRLQQNLRVCFWDAFKARVNNIKLVLRGSHQYSPTHFKIPCSPLCPPEVYY